MESKSTDWRPGNTVCRCCLTEGCYKDISTEYFWMGKREVYSEMLTETFDLNIAFSKSGGPNSNSRLICEPCISRLRDASDFKRQVQECERTFMQFLDPGSSGVMTEVELDKEVKIEAVKLEEASDEDLFDDRDFGTMDDDDDDDLDDQPLTKLASKIPKKESVDIMELLDSAKVGDKRKASTKLKVSPTKKVSSRIIKITGKEVKVKNKKLLVKATTSSKEPKATVSKLTVKPEKKKKGSVVLKLKWKSHRKFNDPRDNAFIIIDNSNVCPFRWKRGLFACAYCTVTFADFMELKDHTIGHSVDQSCRSDELRYVRDNIKVDITGLQCEICLVKFDDINTFCDHLIAEHDKPINKELGIGVTAFFMDKKQFTCTQCNEHFQFFTKLNTHMNQHFPNNICFQCGKAFTALHRLKAHMNVHESGDIEHKCHRCDETFATRAIKNSHLITVHGLQRYKCPYCNEHFNRYSDRLKHLRAAHGSKIEYPCHLCKSVFSMCNQRTKHIRQVHVKPKQYSCEYCPYQFVTAGQLKNHLVKHIGERTFQCQVCKKAYARAKTLREHMRIHNNDKRFTCEFCNNAYVQKCSLQSHIRTHHQQNMDIKKIKTSNVY